MKCGSQLALVSQHQRNNLQTSALWWSRADHKENDKTPAGVWKIKSCPWSISLQNEHKNTELLWPGDGFKLLNISVKLTCRPIKSTKTQKRLEIKCLSLGGLSEHWEVSKMQHYIAPAQMNYKEFVWLIVRSYTQSISGWAFFPILCDITVRFDFSCCML